MKTLVIAPTATFRKGVSLESVAQLNDEIKDSPDAVRLEQKLNKLFPKGTSKASEAIEQKNYFDMRQIHHIHERNRQKDLEVYEKDALFAKRPMYGISLPVMKLRQKDVTRY